MSSSFSGLPPGMNSSRSNSSSGRDDLPQFEAILQRAKEVG